MPRCQDHGTLTLEEFHETSHESATTKPWQGNLQGTTTEHNPNWRCLAEQEAKDGQQIASEATHPGLKALLHQLIATWGMIALLDAMDECECERDARVIERGGSGWDETALANYADE